MKKGIKILWLPDSATCFWDMETGMEISINKLIIPKGKGTFSWQDWMVNYEQLYKSWLNQDEDSIFRLSDPFFIRTLKQIRIINTNSNNFNLYLWFDVDRTKNDSFKWIKCPVCGANLEINLNYLKNNRLYCNNDFITFPI